MTGGWSNVSRYRPSNIPLDCDGNLKTCESVFRISSKLSPLASRGDGGNGGNPSVSYHR